jgi:hypothetical protein
MYSLRPGEVLNERWAFTRSLACARLRPVFATARGPNASPICGGRREVRNVIPTRALSQWFTKRFNTGGQTNGLAISANFDRGETCAPSAERWRQSMALTPYGPARCAHGMVTASLGNGLSGPTWSGSNTAASASPQACSGHGHPASGDPAPPREWLGADAIAVATSRRVLPLSP